LSGGVLASRVTDDELFLALGNGLGSIEAGRLEIGRWLDPLDLAPRTTSRLEVVFEELIANIVRHGFEAGSDQTILVRVAAAPGRIVLQFEDDGLPFNPVDQPEPPPLETLARAEIGGRGVQLVRRFSESFRYEPAPPEGPGRDLIGRVFKPVNRVSVAIAT
jgi:anti-sigma regulatory factor (Ser/Thr protein kinase)